MCHASVEECYQLSRVYLLVARVARTLWWRAHDDEGGAGWVTTLEWRAFIRADAAHAGHNQIFFIVSTLQIVFNVYCIRIMTYEPGVLVRRQQREYPPELRKEIALAALEVGNNR